MSRIAVMLPSRGRPASLHRTVQLLFARACDAEDVEVLVAVDPDDPATARAATLAGGLPLVATDRWGYTQQHLYYNDLLPLAIEADWLMLWGDDAIMQTDNWDLMIPSIYAKQKHAVLWPQSNGYQYCFPIVPNEWARALGRFSPSAHPDSYWYSVGKGLDRHAEISMSILHDRKDLTGGHDDQTYAHGRGLLGQTGMADDGGAEVAAKDVEVLRRLL